MSKWHGFSEITPNGESACYCGRTFASAQNLVEHLGLDIKHGQHHTTSMHVKHVCHYCGAEWAEQ